VFFNLGLEICDTEHHDKTIAQRIFHFQPIKRLGNSGLKDDDRETFGLAKSRDLAKSILKRALYVEFPFL
jgi:hypothetical protein